MADETPPPLLYHYTSQEGLLGIIRGRSVWATMLYYLNDGREHAAACDIARAAIEAHPHWQFESPIGTFLDYAHERIGYIGDVNVCVCSFTEERDLLSQWRGYCQPGSGFAIGFRGEDVQAAGDRKGWTFGRCIYDKAAQESLIGALVDQAIRDFELISETDPGSWHQPGVDLGFAINAFGPLVKDRAFAEEKEWRLVSRPIRYHDLLLRPGPNTLVPYVEVPLSLPDGSFYVPEVIVGPTVHPELSRKAVNALLFSSGVSKDWMIHSSQVPYRPW